MTGATLSASARQRAKTLGIALFNQVLVASVRALTPRRASRSGPYLVVQLNKIGDFVLTTPLIRAVAQVAGDEGVVLAVSETVADLAQTCPYARAVVGVDTRIGHAPHVAANLRAVAGAVAPVRALGPSVALVPRWSADVAFELVLAHLSGAPRVLGFCTDTTPARRRRNAGYDALMTDCAPGTPGLHESIQELSLLELFGATPDVDARPELWLTQEDRAQAAEALAAAFAGREPMSPLVALAPGAGTAHRRWPPERFAAVAGALVADGASVVVVGSASDAQAARVITGTVSGAADLTGRLSLRETAAVLERCRLGVVNDSGVAHVAAAVGTPLVWISPHPSWAPATHDNAPERYAPLGVPIAVLRPDVPASAACRSGCDAAVAHCILALDAARVTAAARAALAAPGIGRVERA